jgi:ABC-type branched-subunit amino acid transport system ATPase component
VILGGTGSLTGMLVGAIVIIASNQVLDSTSPPNVARVLFYVALIAAVYFTMRRSWVKMLIAFAGTAVFGLVVHAIVDAVWSRGTAGHVTSGGFLTGVIRHWVLLPTNPGRLAVYGYLLMIVCVVAVVQLKGWWRLIVLVPTLYLTAFVWENLLGPEPRGHALRPLRRPPDRGDDDPPAGVVRDGQGGDRLMAARLLELKGVSKAFGGLQVISELDLHVDEHEIVSVIGPNGAGKTTLFNLVTGVYAPDEGEILFDGESIVGPRPEQDHAQGRREDVPDAAAVLNMTVKENVMAAAYGHTRAGVLRSVLRTPGMRREEREIAALAEEKLSFFGERLMGYRWNQPAYSLSYANRRRLEIARAMATNARLLLLDEPAAGMNPAETQEITRLIGQLREKLGYTIFVIEHDMHLVEGISDRVVALDHGIKIAEGSFDEVATDPRVVEAYLGLRAQEEAV